MVAITNAEKVILDRMDKDFEGKLYSEEELKKIALANELRSIIGTLPNLAIYIDEVHHTADSKIKLRQVVNEWSSTSSFNSVLGFSGTPYLEKAEIVDLSEEFKIKNTDISNVVYYYPLINGIGNFLKDPVVKYSDSDTEMIVRNGVKEFLDNYKDTVYSDGSSAKLAIYCGHIETLEEYIYPWVAEILPSYGMDTSSILKYHGGNNKYPKPEGSEAEFKSLDTSISKTRIILLVQIGKEGWNCKSLTGVILPQKGACPTNMVLQTSCRCLRQVEKHSKESALIWLNKFNADTLNKQLKQQQNISLQELNTNRKHAASEIRRYSRMDYLQVPPIDFFQLKVSYQTLVIEENHDTDAELSKESIFQEAGSSLIYQQNMETAIVRIDNEAVMDDESVSLRKWIHMISKESFNTLKVIELDNHSEILETIFNKITTERDGIRYFSHNYDQREIRSQIRRAFVPKRDFSVKEEIIPAKANLLQIEKLASPIYIEEAKEESYYPSQTDVQKVLNWDDNPVAEILSEEEKAAIKVLESRGLYCAPQDPHPERKYTYHYLPYHFDSRLEKNFFSKEILPIIADKGLELYFNGDDTLTEFKIDCYKRTGAHWQYIGQYVPDFLLISRRSNGEIHKIIIIETKGEGWATKFADRKLFMETEFIKKNNMKFGYERFDFLYLEDTESSEKRQQRISKAIDRFFND